MIIYFVHMFCFLFFFFFSSRRRHTRLVSDWSSDVCSSDLWRVPRAPGSVDSSALQKARTDGHHSQSALELEIGEHTSELQSLTNLVCRLLLEKKKRF